MAPRALLTPKAVLSSSPRGSTMKRNSCLGLLALIAATTSGAFASEMRFIQIEASSREERSAIVHLGASIEATRSGSVWAIANPREISALEKNGFKILGNFDLSVARGGHESSFDFPSDDSLFHNFDRTVSALQDMQKKNSDLVALQSIGKSVEGRDIWALHINSNATDLKTGNSARPGVIYMGNHHAREHLSAEVPILFAKYLLDHRRDEAISKLLGSRDIWIIPMINPDGVEFDIKDGDYQVWRKNRRDNKDGTFGVDLNRNYSYEWGTGGSDTDTESEIYMGPKPFSEPETIAIRDFVDTHLNAKVLLTFHTYSELILYPWGHTYDTVPNAKDLATFKKMASTMAQWNHYTPEQTSSLYIASGDTTDWAYATHGIFAFTFEMSPGSEGQGGFYPGEKMITKVFNDNLKPCMYLLQVADNPYKVLARTPTGMLHNYVQPVGLDAGDLN